jgi:hypothetical protein
MHHVVLHHVLQRAGAVVEARPTLKGQRLLPQDIHLLHVLAVPYGFQHGVRQPQRNEVLHGGHAQDVIDAENQPLAGGPVKLGQQGVELGCASMVLPERLFDRHATAFG